MSSVSISFLEELFSSFRDRGIELFQILDFSQEPDQNWIKVDLQKSIFLIFWAFIFADQSLFELVMGALINLLFPANELRLLVILDHLDDVIVKFLNVLVLFSFDDTLAQRFNFFERF